MGLYSSMKIRAGCGHKVKLFSHSFIKLDLRWFMIRCVNFESCKPILLQNFEVFSRSPLKIRTRMGKDRDSLCERSKAKGFQ